MLIFKKYCIKILSVLMTDFGCPSKLCARGVSLTSPGPSPGSQVGLGLSLIWGRECQVTGAGKPSVVSLFIWYQGSRKTGRWDYNSVPGGWLWPPCVQGGLMWGSGAGEAGSKILMFVTIIMYF